jgi:hypothetical protein
MMKDEWLDISSGPNWQWRGLLEKFLQFKANEHVSGGCLEEHRCEEVGCVTCKFQSLVRRLKQV